MFLPTFLGAIDDWLLRKIHWLERDLVLAHDIHCIQDRPVGKVGLPLASSAAQVRSLRKGSNDQLAVTIDSESDCVLNKSQSFEDKGHLFKSLNTSGVVPIQGKMLADRLYRIW